MGDNDLVAGEIFSSSQERHDIQVLWVLLLLDKIENMLQMRLS